MDSRSADWTFHIALSGDYALEIDGALEISTEPLDLRARAQAVRVSFGARSRAWTEPTFP